MLEALKSHPKAMIPWKFKINLGVGLGCEK